MAHWPHQEFGTPARGYPGAAGIFPYAGLSVPPLAFDPRWRHAGRDTQRGGATVPPMTPRPSLPTDTCPMAVYGDHLHNTNIAVWQGSIESIPGLCQRRRGGPVVWLY